MTVEQLMELRSSNEAPFNHQEYTVWLHNKIIDAISYDIYNYRERGNTINKNGYAVCNHIINLKSLQKAN